MTVEICATKDCNREAHYDEATEACAGRQYPYCVNCLDDQAERARERAEFNFYHPS